MKDPGSSYEAILNYKNAIIAGFSAYSVYSPTDKNPGSLKLERGMLSRKSLLNLYDNENLSVELYEYKDQKMILTLKCQSIKMTRLDLGRYTTSHQVINSMVFDFNYLIL
jgi:hypothetical protein